MSDNGKEIDQEPPPEPHALAGQIIEAFKKERPEDCGAFSEDETVFGVEYHFSDGPKLWLDIDKEKGISIFWKSQGQAHTLIAAAPGLLAERDQLRAKLEQQHAIIHDQMAQIERLTADRDALAAGFRTDLAQLSEGGTTQ